MLYCMICRREEPVQGKRLCKDCAVAAYEQVIRMRKASPIQKRAKAKARCAGQPRTGYGTTWRYMSVRQTRNSLATSRYEYRRWQNISK
jgi:hypothetical protein